VTTGAATWSASPPPTAARSSTAARLTVRYAFDAMECDFSGELLVKGVERKGAVAERPDTMKEAEQLGMTICRTS
jgi:hypothetical protein